MNYTLARHLKAVMILVFCAGLSFGEEIRGSMADFELPGSASNWNWYWGNAANSTISDSTEQVHGGRQSARVDYVFSKNDGNFTLQCGTPIPPSPTSLSLWVYGDNSGHSIALRIIDRTGETFLYRLALAIDWTGWRQITVSTDKPTETWSGNKDGIIDLPAIIAFQMNGKSAGKGTIYIDDVEITSQLTSDNRISMQHAGEPTGNIWFGAQDKVAVELLVRDRGGAATELQLAYRVLNWNDDTICEGTQTVHVASGSSPTQVQIPFSTKGLFGHYRIAATLRRSDGTFLQRVDTTAAVVPGPQAFSGADNPFGMNLSVARRYGITERATGADLAIHSGMGWSREAFSWETIESEKGKFVWDAYDEPMRVAAHANIEVLGLLGYAAAWARRDSAGYTSPPRDVADYANFVYQVVSRYKGQIKYWEIWNEPDSPSFWPPKSDAAEYTALLKAAYAAAKRADPSCHVLTAGLLVGMCHRDNWAFLEEMYRLGAKDAFDILAWHAYCDPRSPEEGGYAKRLVTLRQIMDKNGDADKPIWLTEEGWATAPGQPRSVDTATQAQYLVRAHVLSLAANGVEKFFWFLFRDGGNWESDFDQSYGILYPDNTPKPAFSAYAAMTHALQKKTFVATTFVGMTNDLACYAFQGDGEATVVICYTGADQVTLRTEINADPTIIVLDHFGNAVAPSAGKLELTFDAAPVYIVAPKARLAEILEKLSSAGRTDKAIQAKEPTHSLMLEDFEEVGWGSEWNLGWLGSGHEGTVLSASAEQVHAGKTSGKLAFQLDPTKGKYGLCYAQVDRIAELPEGAKIIGMWVYGDASGNSVTFRLIDRNDEVFQYNLAAKIERSGWQYLEARLDRPVSHFGGDKNGRLDYPIRFQGLIVSVKPMRKTEGVVFFDDLVVKY